MPRNLNLGQLNEASAYFTFPLGGAVSFGAGGYVLTTILLLFAGVDLPEWVLVSPAAIVGAIVGSVWGRRWIEVRRETREVTAAMGFRPISDEEIEKLEGRIRTLCGDRVSLSYVAAQSKKHVRMTVGILKLTKEHHDSSDSATEQSFVWLESTQMDLPTFTLAPECRGYRLLAKMGLPDLDFDDSPEFSNNYTLCGDFEAQTRALFSPTIRDYFAKHTGWQLYGRKGRLLLFQPNKIHRAEQLKPFIRDAAKLFRMLSHSEQFVEELRSDAGPTDEECLEEIDKWDGLIGGSIRKRARKRFVSKNEFEAFLNQPTPRQLTDGMKERYKPDLMLCVISLLFMVVGFCFFVAPFLEPGHEFNVELCYIGALFGGIGATVYVLANLSGFTAKRLLIHGTLTRGRIESVQETDIIINNARRFIARVRYQVEEKTVRATCNLYRGDANRAHEWADEEVTVNVLYNPNSPRKLLIVDLLMIR